MSAFGIQHKATGLFFGGFGQTGDAQWVTQSCAKAMDHLSASAQAMLLAMDDRAVQRKPVSL